MRMLVSLTTLAALVLAVPTTNVRGADDDTPAAAKTRKLLKKKISVDFKDTRLEDAMNEIKEEVKGFKFLLDAKGGVSRNQTITYSAKDKTVEVILDEMLKKPDLGYIVISKKGNAYDGLIQVRKSKERGTPKN
jgi:hypothetical protein